MITKYSISDLEIIYKKYWKQGYGSIAKIEVIFIQDLIEQYKPQDFIEVGMASGISGGLIAQMLDWSGASSFTTIDHDNTFFGDSTKPNGFLISEIYPTNNIEVTKRPFTTTLNMDKVDQEFDMGFIDANHQHPWPLIDTLLLYQYLKGPKILVHHDLMLFRNQNVPIGIGPKYLYDQFPEGSRLTSSKGGPNIFALDLSNIDKGQLKDIAINAFNLPWSLRNPLDGNTIDQITVILKNSYDVELSETFTKCVSKFNTTEKSSINKILSMVRSEFARHFS